MGKDSFKTPAFSKGTVHGPICPGLDRQHVFGILKRVREQLAPDRSLSNDAVMIYYQGEVDEAEGLRLRIQPGGGTSQSDFFSLADIRHGLHETRGPKLSLLDASRVPGQPRLSPELVETVSDDPSFGVLRFSQRTPATTPETRLSTLLGDAVRQKHTLGEVSEEIKRRSAELQRSDPGFEYLADVPPNLRRWVVGRAPVQSTGLIQPSVLP